MNLGDENRMFKLEKEVKKLQNRVSELEKRLEQLKPKEEKVEDDMPDMTTFIAEVLGRSPDHLAIGNWKCPGEITYSERELAKHNSFWAERLKEMEIRYAEAAKKNFLGVCVYDNEEDPCWDCCLFCGDPDERK